MNTEDIKKMIYKAKPVAKLCYVTKNGLVYVSEMEDKAIIFVVPLNDLGDAKFSPEMDAKLMLRYLNTVNQIIDN